MHTWLTTSPDTFPVPDVLFTSTSLFLCRNQARQTVLTHSFYMAKHAAYSAFVIDVSWFLCVHFKVFCQEKKLAVVYKVNLELASCKEDVQGLQKIMEILITSHAAWDSVEQSTARMLHTTFAEYRSDTLTKLLPAEQHVEDLK